MGDGRIKPSLLGQRGAEIVLCIGPVQRKRLAGHVQECLSISGDYGYRLKLRARDVEQFEKVLRERIQTIRGVLRTRVELSLSVKKDSTLLPLVEGGA